MIFQQRMNEILYFWWLKALFLRLNSLTYHTMNIVPICSYISRLKHSSTTALCIYISTREFSITAWRKGAFYSKTKFMIWNHRITIITELNFYNWTLVDCGPYIRQRLCANQIVCTEHACQNKRFVRWSQKIFRLEYLEAQTVQYRI